MRCYPYVRKSIGLLAMNRVIMTKKKSDQSTTTTTPKDQKSLVSTLNNNNNKKKKNKSSKRKGGFRKRVITRHLGALKVLQSLGPVNLSALLPHLTGSLQKSICDCAHNVVNNSKNILSTEERKHLKPKLIAHKKNLRKLTEPKLKNKDRIDRLIQTGGTVLSDVLSSAIPALIGLLAAA